VISEAGAELPDADDEAGVDDVTDAVGMVTIEAGIIETPFTICAAAAPARERPKMIDFIFVK
jgi:hypothetical protein